MAGMGRLRLAWIALASNALIGVLFLSTFRANLHCTQYTSFRIAAFDMEPHVEEIVEGPAPFVYGGSLAVALRVYLVVVLIAFLLGPSIAAIGVLRQRLSRKAWLQIVSFLSLMLLLNAILPNAVAGERWSALNGIAIAIMGVPLVLLAVSVAAPQPRR